MKIIEKKPPRPFTTQSADGSERNTINDCGEITLEPNELVSIRAAQGYSYDLVCKDFGFYATPSDKRLAKEGLRAAVVSNSIGKKFILIVHEDKIDQFRSYLSQQNMHLAFWLDEGSP